jgi:hypothetical protein
LNYDVRAIISLEAYDKVKRKLTFSQASSSLVPFREGDSEFSSLSTPARNGDHAALAFNDGLG